jgi:hypothetical protein
MCLAVSFWLISKFLYNISWKSMKSFSSYSMRTKKCLEGFEESLCRGKRANRNFEEESPTHSFTRCLGFSCFIKHCYMIFTLSKREQMKGGNLDFERKEKMRNISVHVHWVHFFFFFFFFSRGQAENSNSRLRRWRLEMRASNCLITNSWRTSRGMKK